jgi:O-acetyl-ADP-ribose deacetylase (regulator of RNase III)
MNSLKITFIDLDGQFTNAIKNELIQGVVMPFKNIDTYTGDVLEFNSKYGNEDGLAYLSPANSLGFMDGGIDLPYSQNIFPGIEKEVKWNIANLKRRNLMGQSYLPIGSALITKRESRFLISAPTMWLPQDVSETNNAKHAFLGVLYVIHMWNHHYPNQKIKHLVCPGLATGWGKMTSEQSVKQIKTAINEYNSNNLQPYHWRMFLDTRTYLEEHENVIKEQPNYYQNTQWKQIQPSLIKPVIRKID